MKRAWAVVVVVLLLLIPWQAVPEASAFYALPGTLGQIADGGSTTPGTWGFPRNVQIPVGGLTKNVTGVRLRVSITHSFVGDLNVVLISPGGVKTHTVFSRTGATSAGSFGASGDLNGLYVFADAAVYGWWNIAAGVTGANVVPPALYNTSAPGPSSSPPPTTYFATTFGGLTPAQANGTWTLQVSDGTSGDTGTVNFAVLDLYTGGTYGGVNSFDTDEIGDWSVLRHEGAGIMWYVNSSTDGFRAFPWGLYDDDLPRPGDYDGDGRTDAAVFRRATATFYVRRSSDGGLMAQHWGQALDWAEPADYDGDGKMDFAVYRPGATATSQSFWYILRSSDGVVVSQQWGLGGDAAIRGDYDGDGRADLTVFRTVNGQTVYFSLCSTTGYRVTQWGLDHDYPLPFDFDGDGATDFASYNDVDYASKRFIIRQSSNGLVVFRDWGLKTDFVAPADYDGDGKIDIAVWRHSTTPGASAFYVLRSTTGTLLSYAWGAQGDIPVPWYTF